MAEVHYIEGGVVDGYCPKCEGSTEHTIVKATKRTIREVRCDVCHFVHKYQKAVAVAKNRRARKKSSDLDDTAQVQAEWEAVCLEHASEEPRTYDMAVEWPSGSVILHPIFGKGVVTKRLGATKIEVIFQTARKKLVQNLSRQPS